MAPQRIIKKGEAREQEIKELLTDFQSKPLDDIVPVSDRTSYKRGYAMRLFKEYRTLGFIMLMAYTHIHPFLRGA